MNSRQWCQHLYLASKERDSLSQDAWNYERPEAEREWEY
jgi:hypothetical protein